MEVTVNLYSSLRKGNEPFEKVQLQQGGNVTDLLRELNIELSEVEVVVVNGSLSQFDTQLNSQDQVVLIPFVSGG